MRIIGSVVAEIVCLDCALGIQESPINIIIYYFVKMSRNRSKKVTEKASVSDTPKISSHNGGKVRTDTCKICCLDFSDPNYQMLVCERCDSFVCRSCTDITGEQFELLIKARKLHWFCDDCESLALTAVKNDLVEQKCNEILNNFKSTVIEDFKTEIASMRADINTLKKGQNTLPPEQLDCIKNSKDQTEENTNEIMRRINETEEKKQAMLKKNLELEEERNERAKRVKNVIMFGIPEANDGDNKDDISKAQMVLKELQVHGDKDSPNPIEQVTRLGRRGDRPRPMKISLISMELRNAALRSSKQLKDHKKECLRKVYVGADQTITQREQAKELRGELKRRRETGEDVVIYRKRVIPREKFREQVGKIDNDVGGNDWDWDEE